MNRPISCRIRNALTPLLLIADELARPITDPAHETRALAALEAAPEIRGIVADLLAIANELGPDLPLDQWIVDTRISPTTEPIEIAGPTKTAPR